MAAKKGCLLRPIEGRMEISQKEFGMEISQKKTKVMIIHADKRGRTLSQPA